ncbi:MAG: hypothetical protein ACRCZJ_04410 [Erysipelotrichaceae bacterium]
MTHEMMQMLIIGFLGAIVLFFIYSSITSRSYAKKKAAREAALVEQLEGYKKRMGELDARKILMAQQLKTDPFSDLENLQNELKANMEESHQIIQTMKQVYESNQSMPLLADYAQVIQGYIQTFRQQDEYFSEIFKALIKFVQSKQNEPTNN